MFEFSYSDQNTWSQAFVHKMWIAASWRFNCQYPWKFIHHPSTWDCRASIYKVAKLADTVREVVQGKYLCIVEFWFVDMMLNNVWINLFIIFNHGRTLCSHTWIVPGGVTGQFFLVVRCEFTFQGFKDILYRITGLESTESIFVTMNLLQIIPHVLDHAFCMLPVLCHKGKFLTHNRASVKAILLFAERFKRVAAKSGKITSWSACLTIPLYCVTWLYGSLNWM